MRACSARLHAFLAAASLLPWTTIEADDNSRDWTVQDSVAVRYLVRIQTFAGTFGRPKTRDAIIRSPDQSHFFFMTFRGNLHDDCPEHELRVYAFADVERALSSAFAPAPTKILRACGYNRTMDAQGIPSAYWTKDSSSIVYSAIEQGRRQLFRYQLATGVVDRLSAPEHDVFTFSLEGDGLVYTVGRSVPPQLSVPTYPLVPWSIDVVRASLPPGPIPNRFTIFGAYKGGTPRPLASVFDWESPGAAAEIDVDTRTWISPNGRLAIVLRALDVPSVPSSWSAYDGIGALQDSADLHNKTWQSRARRFLLLDLVNGTSRPIFDAPGGDATWVAQTYNPSYSRGKPLTAPIQSNVLWTSDNSKALIANTALPLNGDPVRSRTSYLVEYEVANASWRIITPLTRPAVSTQHSSSPSVTRVVWCRMDREVLVERDIAEDAGAGLVSPRYSIFRLKGDKWIRTDSERRPCPVAGTSVEAAKSRISVVASEGMNEPPQVLASNGRLTIPLLPPDPAMEGAYRAPVREFEWTEPDGVIGKGGLIMPRNTALGAPVPLVIQAYNWDPELFLPDGPSSSAYAGQALAARGFAVITVKILAVNSWTGKPYDRSEEGPSFVRRIDAVTAALANRGWIDPHRVGYVGFSRAGYVGLYAATHPGTVKLKAAVIADSTTQSYGEYTLTGAIHDDLGEARTLFEPQYRDHSFWQNKEVWLQRAPLFNLERASATPLLFMEHGTDAPLVATFELLGALRLSQATFDMLFFMDGTHQLRRPREREASMQATVDWMTFWLADQVPDDPERAKRWGELKRLKEAQSSLH